MAVNGNGLIDPIIQFVDGNGKPYAGGSITFTQVGVGTLQTVYSDPALTTPLTNPVSLNAAGRSSTSTTGPDTPVYFQLLPYDMTLKDANGVTVWGPITFSGSTIPVTTAATDNSVCDFRLTLTSGTPVTVTDVTGATTVWFTPYLGNAIALFDGVATWNILSSVELSIALGTDAANLPYDVFAFNNNGTVAIERLVWTSLTARATALTLQNGVLVKSGATTRRYIGTYCTTNTQGQVEDSFLNRFVWNYYNRVERPLRRIETTGTWTYSTATFRQANASTANQIALVLGVAEELATIRVQADASNSSGTNTAVAVAVGVNSTTTPAAGCIMQTATTGAVVASATSTALLLAYPAIGRTQYIWLEYSDANATTTWEGSTSTYRANGITGSIRG